MRFMLRIAFWFGLVALLLPAFRTSDSSGGQAKPVDPLDAASAATATFSDVRGFTTFSEKLAPEELMRVINQYLTVSSHSGSDEEY